MISFPKWAWPWLPSQNDQVSHGLNLVLELDPAPNKLPLLLWDIVIAQDKIKRALAELSFVHYARFVPSWDGRALMVTTEFDGPLDPYVRDFVIALGDVFDTLLSYVKTPPPMPIRENPDEFIEWVSEWNRVPFGLRSIGALFPKGFDYPLYCAYPDKTVIDIAGPRARPFPALDHPAANVDPADVQGNILRGYHAKHARYLLFSIGDAVAARSWLAGVFPRPDTLWKGLTSAASWTKPEQSEILTQVGFTADGLSRLLPPSRQTDLEHFPCAFKEGATARARDNLDIGTSDPAEWLFGGSGVAADVVLIVYTKTDPPAPAYIAAVNALKGGDAKGLTLLKEFYGEWGRGEVSFRFADGLSDPSISGQRSDAAFPDYQPSASPGEFLLHKDYLNIYGGTSLGKMPQGLAGNGSFGVLRLMEADEARFEKTILDEAARLNRAARFEITTPDRLKAKLMGRWEKGTPMTLAYAQPGESDPPFPVNTFDYAPSWEFPNEFPDHEGLRCPVGAHIRRANPRSARVAGQPHSRRLIRRGMPVAWQEGAPGSTALMGLFFGAHIEEQFEFILRQWLNGGLAASGIHGTTCPIVGNRITDTDFPFLESDADPAKPPILLVAKIPQLVRTRGCLYLFFPGISALRALNAAICPVDTAVGVIEAVAHGVAEGAEIIVHAARDAVAEAGSQLGELVGGLLGATGHAVAGVAGVAARSAAQVSRLLCIDSTMSSVCLAELDKYLALLPPYLVRGSDWRDIIRDIVTLDLDSPWVKQMIESFSPLPVQIPAPANDGQGGIDLANPSFCANPFVELAKLRDAEVRMVWVKERQAYWVLGYADCLDLLDRNADFVQTQSGGQFRGIVTLDDPRHAEVRKAFLEAFTISLNALDVDGPVRRTISSLNSQKYLLQFDYMKGFAHPAARSVVWDLLGIEDVDVREALDKLADKMVLNFGHGNDARAIENIVFADAGLRLAGRLALALSEAWLQSSLGAGSPYAKTLIGELAARMGPVPVLPNRPLGFIETLMTLVQTVVASQSPHFLLGSAALHLLRPLSAGASPWSQLAKKLGTPDFDSALETALSETRRYEPPLSLIDRYANGKQKICGIDVPDGCQVSAMIASANRDTRGGMFGNLPEEFQADRSQSCLHLSLGYGIHECAGKALQARLVTSALSQAIEAWPGLRLSKPAATPAWHATIHFRVLQALSVARC